MVRYEHQAKSRDAKKNDNNRLDNDIVLSGMQEGLNQSKTTWRITPIKYRLQQAFVYQYMLRFGERKLNIAS